MQINLPDLVLHVLERLRAHRRQEARKDLPMAVLGHARAELIAEKRKLDLRKLPAATAVLAIDHLGLLRMQLQPVGSESLLHGVHKPLCLNATAADQIVRIALRRDVRKTPPHPGIKRLMQIQIDQQRTDDTSLGSATGSFLERPIRQFHRYLSPLQGTLSWGVPAAARRGR